MCPPVSTRHGAEGMSYLHAAWVYQLQHGQLRVCFACFKAAFLNLRQWLEWEDWEDEDWDPEPMDPTEAEAGSEQGASPGMWPSWGQGQGQPAGAGPVDWGLGTLASGPVESEEVGLSDPFVTTELEPQGATPLGLGAEDADWTQGLPWRFEVPPTCSHWPSPPTPWEGFFKVDVPPGWPMVLELGTTRAMDPAEAQASLLDLQVLSLVGCYDAVYLRKMKPEWALRTPEQRWQVLLEPEELWVVRLQDAPPKQELHQWHLSILESRPPGQDEELVRAESALLKRGFTIFSFSPWIKREAVEGDSASRPESSTQGCDPSTSGPSGPGESLAFTGASALGELPRFPPFSPGPQN
ncbi:testis-expressed protein 19.2-like [Hippopotamus amphibius kiboko]|uniref:testis-expressed protein 19.2-like n=1 Tax=Hippopotamus amphibius kiboko TaxID=575201 RepID=UPI0025967A4E|nr:testis-expressed protein 19.2-like [Hippopotamus amphibius kiboko]